MANLKDLIVNGSARILGTLYAEDIKNSPRTTEFIVGTQTAATGSFTGVTRDTALYDGKSIHYFLPYAGSGNATLDLTLAGGGTTGAIPIYRSGTSYLTTHYGANSCISMTYNSSKGAWFCDADYNTNDTNRLCANNAILAKAACTAGKLICGDSSGYQDVASGVTFDIKYPLLRCGTTKAAGATSTDNWLAFNGVNLQTTKASWTGTQYSIAYLVGTLSGTTFTIDSSVFTSTIPTTQDNKVYMPVGILYSTYQIYFYSSNDLYAYIDGSFQKLSTKYVQGSGTQPIYFDSNGQPQNTTYTLSKSVPSDAVFTDTKNTAGSTDTSSKIFLVGATSQAANPQTYSHDTAFVDANGRLNSAAPASSANDTTVATTKWVKDQGYTNNTGTVTSVNSVSPVNGNVSLTIPTVNNATLTIQKNGSTVKTFTANASTDVTCNITVPTKVSELTNDSGYKTTDTQDTCGAGNSTSKLFLVGRTAQSTGTSNSNSSVYTQSGYLYATTPASTTNDTTVATTAFVKAQGYTTNTGTVTSVNNVSPVNGNVSLTIPTYNFHGDPFYSTDGDTAGITKDCNSITANGHYYYTSNGPSGLGEQSTDGALFVQAYSDNWVTQIAQDYRTGNLFIRSKNNGTWTAWRKATPPTTVAELTDSSNYIQKSDVYFTASSGTLSFGV